MPLVANTDSTLYGDVYYSIYGSDDFELVLLDMVADTLILDTDVSTYRSSYDGYRIKFTVVNSPIALNAATDDIMAVCFYL